LDLLLQLGTWGLLIGLMGFGLTCLRALFQQIDDRGGSPPLV